MNKGIMESVLNSVKGINKSTRFEDARNIYKMTQFALEEASKLKVIDVDEWLFLTKLIDEVWNNWR